MEWNTKQVPCGTDNPVTHINFPVTFESTPLVMIEKAGAITSIHIQISLTASGMTTSGFDINAHWSGGTSSTGKVWVRWCALGFLL